MSAPIAGIGEMPYNVVEGRPKMMDYLSGQNGEPGRDNELAVIGDCLQNNLSVTIWDDGVVALLEKFGNLRIKILDVLVGPY